MGLFFVETPNLEQYSRKISHCFLGVKPLSLLSLCYNPDKSFLIVSHGYVLSIRHVLPTAIAHHMRESSHHHYFAATPCHLHHSHPAP